MPPIASIGAAVLGSLGVAGPVTAGAAYAAGTATVGAGIYGARKLTKSITDPIKNAKQAASGAAAQTQANINELKQSQAQASTEAAKVIQAKKRAIRGSQSVFTTPLGLTGEASVARKTLLGQ